MSVDRASACPDDERLACALEDDAHELHEHVEACEPCQQRLSELVTEGEGAALLSELRKLADISPTSASEDPTIKGLDIVRELHRGGQGIVYEASVQTTGERVAVKSVLGGRWATQQELSRFEREVGLVASLDHPHIVTLLDSGRAADGTPYYTMELIEGLPLDRFVLAREHDGRGLTRNELVELFLAIGTAVEFAHRNGVIHRDLKPSNILVNERGAPYVLDFGLAKSLEPGAERTLTRTGDFVGSPAWAAPEQVRGHVAGSIDTRTDVYALGLILYRLVTGHHAYPINGTLMSVVDHILHTPPTPLRQHLGHRAPNLEAVLRRALEKDPGDRYETVTALLADCQRWQHGDTVTARRSSAARMWRSMRRHPVTSAGLTAVVVTLAMVAWLKIRQVDQLEYVQAREIVSSLPDAERRHFRSEEELWEAILTGRPYRSAKPDGFPAPLPYHWSLRNVYLRMPVLRRKIFRNVRYATFHPLREEVLLFGREAFVGAFSIPGLEELDFPEAAGCYRTRFSPDGTLIAVTSTTEAVIKKADGSEWRVPTQGGELQGVDFLGNDRLFMNEDGVIRVWDLDSRTIALELGDRFESPRSFFGELVVSTPDGLVLTRDPRKWIADTVRFFAPSLNQEHATFVDEEGVKVWSGLDEDPTLLTRQVSKATGISNDGRLVAMADGSRVRTFNLVDGKGSEEELLVGHVRPVLGLNWSRTGRYLLSWDEVGELLVWEPDLRWSRALLPQQGTYSGVHSIALRGERIGATGQLEGASQAIILERDVHRPAHVLPFPTSPDARFSSCAFLDDTTLVLAGRRGLYVWPIDGTPPTVPTYALAEDTMVGHLSLSPNGERVACVDDAGVIHIVEVDDLLAAPPAKATLVVDEHLGYRMCAVAWAPDGETLVAARPYEGGLVRVDARTGVSTLFDTDTKTPARCIEYHPTMRFFVTGDNHGSLRFWDADSNRFLDEIPNAHTGRVYAAEFDESGRLLCTGDSNGEVHIWYVAERPDGGAERLPAPVFSFTTPHADVLDIAFAGSNRIVTGGNLTSLVEWDLAALDRYIGSNLEGWVERLEGQADPGQVARMRAWADQLPDAAR
jgi:WD40 repeat protein